MSKIKIAEKFFSVQGEGRYQGVPSVFLRTFGCNFKCRGFGRDIASIPKDETHNPEVVAVINDLSLYKNYKDLPLVKSGCDSYAAVYPEFKNLSPLLSVDDLAQKIVDLLPFKEWRDEHLVITGGEPLLGWQRAYPDLLEHPLMAGLKEITFETNGTQKLSNDFKHYLLNVWQNAARPEREVTFSVSAKLSGSGETREEAIQPSIVCAYQEVGYTYLKFVVASEKDVDEALEVIDIYRSAGFRGPVYLMAEGGVVETHILNTQKVALLALKHGLRYSARLQVDLFRNQWGT